MWRWFCEARRAARPKPSCHVLVKVSITLMSISQLPSLPPLSLSLLPSPSLALSLIPVPPLASLSSPPHLLLISPRSLLPYSRGVPQGRVRPGRVGAGNNQGFDRHSGNSALWGVWGGPDLTQTHTHTHTHTHTRSAFYCVSCIFRSFYC